MGTKPHVCHIITRLIVGGAQENTILTCQGLHERGWRVTLITGQEAGPEGHLLDEARRTGYEVIVLDSMRRAINPIADRRALLDLTDLLARLRPDVIHTHSSKAGILGRFAARNLRLGGTAAKRGTHRAPVVLHTIHGMSFNRTQSWMTQACYRFLERQAARSTDCIITVADAMIDQAVEARIAPRERFRTVYSGMRTDWFSPELYDRRAIRQGWGFTDEHVVVGAIARLFRNKGYEQLIPAMADAAARRPELRFVWVGDGAQRTDYEEELEFRGLRIRTHLTGLVDPSQVARTVAGMDLLVHASQWEGLPRAAVQALLMRVPVISFDIDGAPEVVIPGKTGLLVPLNDVDGLTNAIGEFTGDADRRRAYGQAGRERCLHQFDWRHMVEEIEKLYRELLANQPVKWRV
ncbi:MAG: glycosyltransferase family 4 protein [Planctomycetes bacterium]|nr:glycosyltransferase family 4 protein [Planctomycetota bacterium]